MGVGSIPSGSYQMPQSGLVDGLGVTQTLGLPPTATRAPGQPPMPEPDLPIASIESPSHFGSFTSAQFGSPTSAQLRSVSVAGRKNAQTGVCMPPGSLTGQSRKSTTFAC